MHRQPVIAAPRGGPGPMVTPSGQGSSLIHVFGSWCLILVPDLERSDPFLRLATVTMLTSAVRYEFSTTPAVTPALEATAGTRMTDPRPAPAAGQHVCL